MEVNELIKQRRLEKGLTLEQVADKVGVGKSTVRKWETGFIKNMRRDKIVKLAEALDLSPTKLMGYSDKSEYNSQFGTDQELIEYFRDQPELLSMYKDIQQSDSLQLLFDSTKDLSPEDLKPVLEYIYTIRKAKGLE